MDKIVIIGGKKLRGDVYISGSKNAALPIMIATLLASGRYNLTNVPELKDIDTTGKLLNIIGADVKQSGNEIVIETTGCNTFEAPYDLVRTMRASIYVLGPLVARYGQAKVSLPGGCAWGPRPVDLHIEAMKKLHYIISIDALVIMWLQYALISLIPERLIVPLYMAIRGMDSPIKAFKKLVHAHLSFHPKHLAKIRYTVHG